MKELTAHDLRTLATAKVPQATQDASGQPSTTLDILASFWCAVKAQPMSQVRGDKISATIMRYDLFTRYTDTLAAMPLTAIVEVSGVQMQVSAVDPVDFSRDWLRITAEQVR